MIPEGERPIKKVIGENIEKYFLESDYPNLTAFSDAIGLDTVRVKKIFAGESSVMVDKLQSIAKLLDVKTIDLVEDWRE